MFSPRALDSATPARSAAPNATVVAGEGRRASGEPGVFRTAGSTSGSSSVGVGNGGECGRPPGRRRHGWSRFARPWCLPSMDSGPVDIRPADLGARLAQLRLVPAADVAMEASLRRYGQFNPLVV